MPLHARRLPDKAQISGRREVLTGRPPGADHGNMAELMLHEEILLLALDNEKGTAPFGSMYTYGMAGGIITELVLRGRLRLEKVKKSLLVDVALRTQTGEPLLDEVLEKVATAKRRASIQTWVSRIAQTRKLHERVANRLRDRGVLRREEGRVLLFFPRKTWPTQDEAPERALVNRIVAAIRGSGSVDGRTATIIALAKSARVLEPHLEKGELKARKERIEEIVNGNVVGDATQEAIEAVAAAMIATSTAITVATMAATS